MTMKEKIQQYIDYKGISVYRLEADAGLSKGYWGKTKSISADIAMKISRIYGDISADWLLRDEGGMIINGEKIIETPHYESLKGQAVPHIDVVTASCGLPNGFNHAIMKEDCERYIIPDMPGCDFTIRAGGRSMINREVPERSINDRDIVGCRIITTRSHIRWGEVYALATQDGIMIKKIVESDEEGCIKCVPFNAEEGFKPYDVPVSEIYDWALVVGVVSVKTWI